MRVFFTFSSFLRLLVKSAVSVLLRVGFSVLYQFLHSFISKETKDETAALLGRLQLNISVG